MKKLLTRLLIFPFLAFGACSDDDKHTDYTDMLQGKWKTHKVILSTVFVGTDPATIEEASKYCDTIVRDIYQDINYEFRKDNWFLFTKENKEDYSKTGSYELNESLLTMTPTVGDKATMNVSKFDADLAFSGINELDALRNDLISKFPNANLAKADVLILCKRIE